MFNRIFLFSILSFSILTGCEQKYLENTKEIAAEVEQHKIKRITTPMINRETQRVGDSLVMIAIKAVQPPATADSCNLAGYPEVAEISELYQAKAGFVFVSDKPKYQFYQNRSKTWEKAINAGDPELSDAKVYNLGDSLFYVRPIATQTAAMLPCFTPAGNTTETAGYWYIRFEKKGIIEAITRKVKKGHWGRKK